MRDRFATGLLLAICWCMAVLFCTLMQPSAQWDSTIIGIVLFLIFLLCAFIGVTIDDPLNLFKRWFGSIFEMREWLATAVLLLSSLCVAVLLCHCCATMDEAEPAIIGIVLFPAILSVLYMSCALVQFIRVIVGDILNLFERWFGSNSDMRSRHAAALFLVSLYVLYVAVLCYISVQFIRVTVGNLLNLFERWFGPNFEMRGWLATVLFLVSLCVAVLFYYQVQLWTQQSLVSAYRKADVVSAFCKSRTAFAHSVCEESNNMSWQQVHTLLLTANVINHSDFETAADLKANPPSEHKRLIEELLNDSKGNCTGRRAESWNDQEHETALQLVYRLSMAQCVCGRTKDNNDSRRANTTKGMASALADAVGGSDLHPPESRCDKARKWLEDLSKGNSSGMSGWRFSTARCLSDSEILTALGVMSKAVISTYNQQDNSEQPIGYNLSGTCHNKEPENANDRSGALKGFEGFTKVNQYLLGVTHTLPEVRTAQKWANLVRGPEHVGILTLGLFTLFTLLVRTWVVHWRCKDPARCHQLADDLTAGGEVADRRLDAVARGRTLVRWAVATVPAIGFIGTVRGILEALAKAGDVVWAGDRLERADAIGQLAGELGLAFSTTLFALLVGVLLGWLMAVTRAYEGRVLDGLIAPSAQG